MQLSRERVPKLCGSWIIPSSAAENKATRNTAQVLTSAAGG